MGVCSVVVFDVCVLSHVSQYESYHDDMHIDFTNTDKKKKRTRMLPGHVIVRELRRKKMLVQLLLKGCHFHANDVDNLVWKMLCKKIIRTSYDKFIHNLLKLCSTFSTCVRLN